jgi:hypothetical protein
LRDADAFVVLLVILGVFGGGGLGGAGAEEQTVRGVEEECVAGEVGAGGEGEVEIRCAD